MTPEKRARLAVLQRAVVALGGREHLHPDTVVELETLERELALEQHEQGDDPKTWLVDESKRPQLDGADWNDFNNAMCRDEVKALGVKYGLPLIKLAVESLLLKR